MSSHTNTTIETDEPTGGEDGRSDEELADQAIHGDYRAFEELVKRYQQQTYRLAFSLVKEEAAAQDVVQDAFLKIYRGLHTFTGQSQLSTWIYRVVLNTALTRLRNRRRRGEVEQQQGTAGLGIRPQWRTQADKAAEQRELRQQILMAVDELEPNYQAVFILREVEGLSVREIAEMLELSRGAVRTRLHRARLHLQAALEPYLGRDEDISAG